MATKSVYVPEPSIQEGVVRIFEEEHRHLRVSRTLVGEAVEIFDGRGRIWPGSVIEIGRKGTRIRLGSMRMAPRPKAQIILAQALIRNSAFEWILEKAVEVGVTRIIPFRAARSNPTGRGRKERWHRILVEASKQSKQYWLPELDSVTDMMAAVRTAARSRIQFREHNGGRLRSALQGSPVLCLIGPEGGWTEGELELAAAAGVIGVQLGPRIMRSETAAIVAASLIAYELGVMEI